MKHNIAVLLENEPGALSRGVGNLQEPDVHLDIGPAGKLAKQRCVVLDGMRGENTQSRPKRPHQEPNDGAGIRAEASWRLSAIRLARCSASWITRGAESTNPNSDPSTISTNGSP